MKNNTVLFGVLYFGESEFSDLIKSIASTQKGYDYTIKCVSFRDKISAHKKLYSIFKKSNCDIFVKLDSDMILKKNLKHIVKSFSESNELHWAMDIYDCYSDRSIPAVHFYRKGFNFYFESKLNCDEFKDGLNPTNWIKDKKFIYHGQHKNDFQAFKTGVSKGVKMRKGKTQEYSKNYINNLKNNDWINHGVVFGIKSNHDVLDAGNPKLIDEFIKQSLKKYRK